MRIVALSALLCCSLAGCLYFPGNPDYAGPPARPASVEQYYSKGSSYGAFTEELIAEEDGFRVTRFVLQTDAGPTTIDYFHTGERRPELIFVFPVLGGRNLFANYFARYFVLNGLDAAVVHRDSAFKQPENFYRVEALLRDTVVRDRIAIDFFEELFDKRKFGGFGLSRGAINLAMTAGADPRMEFNVLALGGTDLAELLTESDEKGLRKFKKRVMAEKDLTEEEMYEYIRSHVKTDPKYLAPYMDAGHTLMILAVFDQTVPFTNGLRLRQAIGRPDTVFLPAGHFTSVAYTRFITSLMSKHAVTPFPFDYVETEALAFFNRSFGRKQFNLRELPIRIFQLPFRAIGAVLEVLF